MANGEIAARGEFAGRLGRKSFRCPASLGKLKLYLEMWDGPQSRVAT